MYSLSKKQEREQRQDQSRCLWHANQSRKVNSATTTLAVAVPLFSSNPTITKQQQRQRNNKNNQQQPTTINHYHQQQQQPTTTTTNNSNQQGGSKWTINTPNLNLTPDVNFDWVSFTTKALCWVTIAKPKGIIFLENLMNLNETHGIW